MSDYKGSFYSGNIYDPKYRIENLSLSLMPSINDNNGNEIIKFADTVTDAVNEINISNSIIGEIPIITASGDDDDIGLRITGKGYRGVSLSSSSFALHENSVAEGDSTSAEGANSHSEGFSNIALGAASHAEGRINIASGDNSHAEGESNMSISRNTHTEGKSNLSAEGNLYKISSFAGQVITLETTPSSWYVNDYIYINVYNNSPIKTRITTITDNSVTVEFGTPASSWEYAVKATGTLTSHSEGYATVSTGMGAHTEGLRTIASGRAAHAEGIEGVSSGQAAHTAGMGCIASANQSCAIGYTTTASGENSYACGRETIANNTNSYAEGYKTVSSGVNSHAEGEETVASGDGSHAECGFTTASGLYSHAEGDGCTSSGETSHAEGTQTTASGYAAHSQGSGTTANTFASHAIGNFNKDLTGSVNSFTSTSDVFVIGNGGGPSAKNNAFRVTFDGKTYGLSAFNSSGADYAELFEWLDGNTLDEDRAGYFVTLDGDKIRKATSTDSYILGIVSATPSVIGNNPDGWCNTYVTDDFGRIKHKEVIIPAEYKKVVTYNENIDEDGVITKIPVEKDVLVREEHTEIIPMYNPDWDSSVKYEPRENRKEWDSIGMMGVLLALDDGTCKVNGYCKSNDNGIATNSDTGYRVMKRVNKNIIQILVK